MIKNNKEHTNNSVNELQDFNIVTNNICAADSYTKSKAFKIIIYNCDEIESYNSRLTFFVVE